MLKFLQRLFAMVLTLAACGKKAETPTPTQAPTEVPTEAPTEIPTEAPTEPVSEAPTEAPAVETNAPETTVEIAVCPPDEKGCGSVIGFGAVAVLMAGAAVVALKKRDE